MPNLVNPFIFAADDGNPPLFANLTSWYDASDTSTITEVAGVVSGLDDKQGNHDLEQNVGVDQPTTGASTQNGLNLIDFDAIEKLETASFTVPASHTVVVLTYITAVASANGSIYSIGSFGGPIGESYQFAADDPVAFEGEINATLLPTLRVGQGDQRNAWHVWAFAYEDSTSADLYLDGVSYASASLPSAFSGTDTFRLNSNRNGADGTTSQFAELLFYDKKLSTAEIGEVITYLEDKWNVTI